jgi:hypothetical protein
MERVEDVFTELLCNSNKRIYRETQKAPLWQDTEIAENNATNKLSIRWRYVVFTQTLPSSWWRDKINRTDVLQR